MYCSRYCGFAPSPIFGLHPTVFPALKSLFESLVYSGFNFFLAMPILLVGLFDKDVSSETATECHKLYAVGRQGMDLNLRVRGQKGREKSVTVFLLA